MFWHRLPPERIHLTKQVLNCELHIFYIFANSMSLQTASSYMMMDKNTSLHLESDNAYTFEKHKIPNI
jgi:hypothetical protein